jgi:protein N-terminal methyltransferase
MSQAITEKNEQAPNEASTTADSNINHVASMNYWSSVPATASGMPAMLGEYPWYSRIELRGSKNFLAKVRRLVPALSSDEKIGLGADCGAGIGRVTEGFLSDVCEVVDIVEPVEKFT